MQKASGVVRFELACASSRGRRAALRSGSLRTRGSTVFRNVKKEITFLVQGESWPLHFSLLHGRSTAAEPWCPQICGASLVGTIRCLVSCKDCACDVQTRMGKLFGGETMPFRRGSVEVRPVAVMFILVERDHAFAREAFVAKVLLLRGKVCCRILVSRAWLAGWCEDSAGGSGVVRCRPGWATSLGERVPFRRGPSEVRHVAVTHTIARNR